MTSLEVMSRYGHWLNQLALAKLRTESLEMEREEKTAKESKRESNRVSTGC